MSGLKKGNTIYLPVLVGIILISAIIVGSEIIFYSGWLKNHLGVSTSTVTLILGVILLPLMTKLQKTKWVELILTASLVLVILLQAILNFIETGNYPNYVYSHFHLNISGMDYLISYLAIAMTASIILNRDSFKSIKNYLARQTKPSTPTGKTLVTAIIFLWFIFALSNVFKDIVISRNAVNSISQKPFINNQQKLKNVYGFYYDYMNFIKERTEDNSRILIPPKDYPWMKEGNLSMDLFFLYPRTLVQGKKDSNDISNVDYVLIAKGSWPKEGFENGWPKEKYFAKKIWYIDEKSLTVTEKPNSYFIPDDDVWGLIKIR